MRTKKYKGIIVPAITPLKKDFTLDESAVERLFESFYQQDISPFILGTTGESASLPDSLKKDYIRKAGKIKKKDSILYAGISSNIISESVELAKFCADQGVDAVAATLPAYYALTEVQMKRFFEELANAISLPLVIYNIPATIHMSVPLAVIDELSYHPNIIATKDSERSEERLKQSLNLWKGRDDFGHFLGWAAKSAEALIGGSDGLIPSTGNMFPEIYAEMLAAVQQKNEARAMEFQQWSDVYGNLYQAGRTLGESLWALKVLLKQKGICEEYVMPPLAPQTDAEREKIILSLVQLKTKTG